ncbi:hypothetical protein GCM10012290_22370 [Halolactibacillus alkaliphilus]|uniref:Uncharacterized protein n=1 Tax=Halolactibacillus alkaliphilus TaxID=442899 RepID=A0A511X3X1_9BACI|nr:hypothetical protein HAL01_21010 [Halolactibacillus alkaliphilus]GGN74482.1 hypothetical protein GCM10012290_22370 [Halolactibacillus alkaliphilus]
MYLGIAFLDCSFSLFSDIIVLISIKRVEVVWHVKVVQKQLGEQH